MESSFKILLVDDQQIVLDGLKKQLNWSRFNGLICGCVSDGAEAINFLQTCRPDVIISDIKMPHMDGIELARQISESPILSGIPVILLSGYREFEYAKSAMQYHVQHYILKPGRNSNSWKIFLQNYIKARKPLIRKFLPCQKATIRRNFLMRCAITISAALKIFSVLRFTITA